MARILVIDDDDVVRLALTRMLERDGHTVISAGDGRKGVAMMSEHAVDLVITDIFMPDQEGLATIMEMRRSAACPPIIAMSGGGRRAALDVLPVAEAFGAVKTVRKPLTPEMVRDAVREALAD